MMRELTTAFRVLIIVTVLTGLVYPLAITGLAQMAFPGRANGSLVTRDNRIIGSELIGQAFSDPGYFHGRPSATPSHPYNALASSGSNLGPTNPSLLTRTAALAGELREANPGRQAVPVDMVTASASGLDPDISLAAAQFQANRVARARGMDYALIRRILRENARNREFLVLGEARVNVLKLNLALDEWTRSHQR